MAAKTQIPPNNVPLVDAQGKVTTPWRVYLSEVDRILGGGTNALESTVNRDIFDSTAHVSAFSDLTKQLTEIKKELAFCDVSPHISMINNRIKQLEMTVLMIKPHDAEISMLEKRIKALENEETFL